MQVKYFGRYKGGAVRNGVLLALTQRPQMDPAAAAGLVRTDEVVAEMEAGAELP